MKKCYDMDVIYVILHQKDLIFFTIFALITFYVLHNSYLVFQASESELLKAIIRWGEQKLKIKQFEGKCQND